MLIRGKATSRKLPENQLLLCVSGDGYCYQVGLLYRVTSCGMFIFDSYGNNPTRKGYMKDGSCCSSISIDTEFILAPNLALLLHGELDEN